MPLSVIKRSLNAAGIKTVPGLPGDFQSSREWGNEAETHQQRWMWSVIQSSSGTALGTLVNVIHHDHTAFRVPHAPDVIALLETDKPAIELALSSRSADFAAALEFAVWYASHLELQGADTLELQGADTLELNTAADLEPAQW